MKAADSKRRKCLLQELKALTKSPSQLSDPKKRNKVQSIRSELFPNQFNQVVISVDTEHSELKKRLKELSFKRETIAVPLNNS